MKKKILLPLLFFVIWIESSAQVIGKTFPAMEAETVEDKKVKLPEDVKGKYTLLGLAYSKKSEDELNSWFQPVFEKFVQFALSNFLNHILRLAFCQDQCFCNLKFFFNHTLIN